MNGLREARGDISANVVNDTLLVTTLTAPAGPSISVRRSPWWQACNTGLRDARGDLNGSMQVYVIAPSSLTLSSSLADLPAGTLLYITARHHPSVGDLVISAPAPLSTATRIAWWATPPLACSSSINMVVTVNNGITPDSD